MRSVIPLPLLDDEDHVRINPKTVTHLNYHTMLRFLFGAGRLERRLEESNPYGL